MALKTYTISIATFLVAVLAIGLQVDRPGVLISDAWAAGGTVTDPNSIAPDRYVYYPGTEVLAEDEIRIVVCGSGMPAARHGQAATCFLVETGNGDKFLFDIGTGSMANVAALMIPYQYLDKIFLTHLHTDHMGDIDAIWAGGWTAGRPGPMRVWGPSGMTPEMGTEYAMENFLRHANWDYVTRKFQLSALPGTIETTEFDYMGQNQVIYEENGVTIRSWPAIHTGDGPVSYALYYRDMKIVIGGDTFPNQWFLEYAEDADLVIHEAFMGPELFVDLYNMAPFIAWRACCAFHTSGQGFGKVMSALNPRMAVAYHFFNEEATRYSLYDNIRETYDGPLSLTTDLMVYNITSDSVTERMAVATHEAWAVPGPDRQGPPEQGQPPVFSRPILEGRLDDLIQPAQKQMLDEFMEKYGLQDQDWRQ